MNEILRRADADGIATLTLNRPRSLNAISYALANRLMETLDAMETDPAVRAVILTGAGDSAFSAGADIVEFTASVEAGAAAALRDFVRRGQRMTERIEAFPKPVIVAVNGLAFGGGCEITEAAHLAVASERALFAKPEVRLGMPPTFGGTQRLPRLAGRKRALRHLLTAEPFGPSEAEAMGLVNAVVPHEGLAGAAEALARAVAAHPPEALAAIITAVTRGIGLPIGEGLLVEQEQFAKVAAGEGLVPRLHAWIARERAGEERSRRGLS